MKHYREELGLRIIPGTGPLAAVVPGAFGGWMAMLRDFGTLHLRDYVNNTWMNDVPSTNVVIPEGTLDPVLGRDAEIRHHQIDMVAENVGERLDSGAAGAGAAAGG